MKRFMLCLALGAGVLSACSASQTAQTAAGLSGTYDITAVSGTAESGEDFSYVFVTSADRNELRVLDIHSSPRDWVRAPNPIEPLSVPVLERPIYLARDIHYDGGEEVAGPYVYARSTGTNEISIVGAYPSSLKEVKRLRERPEDPSGFITAFASRGGYAGGDSVLYYARQEESGARLFRVQVPKPDAIEGSGDLQPQEIVLAAPLTGLTVTALLVMPTAGDTQERVVVATRKTSATAAQSDRTFLLDVSTGTDGSKGTEIVTYKFGGPVRLLATNPKVSNLNLDDGSCLRLDEAATPKFDQNADHSLNEGTYVFAALDESVCTQRDQESCAGILAVDAMTGELAQDPTGSPMLPIRVGQALPTGLSIAADAHVLMRCNGSSAVMRRPLVGIVPASDGRITIFDAARLRSFDLNTPTDANQDFGAVAESGNTIIDANGTTKSITRFDEQGNPNFKAYISLAPELGRIKEGATRDDTYRVLLEGALQGLSGRPVRMGGDEPTVANEGAHSTFSIEPQAVQVGSGGELPMVRPGDIITLSNSNGFCVDENGVQIDFHVAQTAVGPLLPNTTGPVTGLLITQEGETLPTDLCPDASRFTVRAGKDAPLVVFSDAQGYLGRLPRQGGDLPIPGGYYYRPDNFSYDPRFATVSAYLHVDHTAPDDDAVLKLSRGDQLIVTAQSGVQPFTASIDSVTTTGGLTGFRLPGPVVHVQVNTDPTTRVDLAYIAYPSANGILQVSLAGLQDNVANLTGLVPFE